MSGVSNHPVFVAIEPLLDTAGAEVVAPDEFEQGDIPIEWEGEVIGGVRLGSLSHAMDRMVTHIESEFGARLADLSRTDKQAAIRMLDEQGAFLLRKSIDDVADRMGVSRITIYNYLTLTRDS